VDEERAEDRYLAKPKEFEGERPFESAVLEAFALEYGIAKNEPIAKMVGVNATRLSHYFKDPQKMRVQTVHNIIRCLRSSRLRKSILKAWNKECFGSDEEAESNELLSGEVSAITIKKIDRLVRMWRPERALQIAEEAAAKCREPEMLFMLLSRVYFLQQRLDLAGSSMATAERVYEWGKEDNNGPRMVVALYMKGRILRGLDGVSPRQMAALHEEAMQIIESIPSGKVLTGYERAANKETVGSNLSAFMIKKHEEEGGYENYLREALQKSEIKFKAGDSRNTKYGALQTQARLHLGLGEPFKAEEALERAFSLGEFYVLNSNEQTSLIQAKIMAARGSIDEAVEYYKRLCRMCEEHRSFYYLRQSQRDLALLLSRRFPPARPV
jgi:tetratricopeptide (TPR) repeat protein